MNAKLQQIVQFLKLLWCTLFTGKLLVPSYLSAQCALDDSDILPKRTAAGRSKFQLQEYYLCQMHEHQRKSKSAPDTH